MTDKTIPILHLPPRERERSKAAREWVAPHGPTGTPETPHGGWRITKQVDIAWLFVVLLLAISGWVYGISNRVTALETRQQDTQVLMQSINAQLQHMNDRFDALYEKSSPDNP